MKYTNGYHGMIWEMKLSDELGYGYVKTTEPNRIIDKNHIGFLGQILDYRSEAPLKKVNMELFKEVDPLCAPFLLAGYAPGKGDDRWKALGYCLTGEEEVPLFKGYEGTGTSIENSTWSVIYGSALVDFYEEIFTYQQTKHLNVFHHVNVKSIKHRFIMEWMRKIGLDYTSYHPSELEKHFLDNQKHQMNYTVQLKNIPKEFWYKPLP